MTYDPNKTRGWCDWDNPDYTCYLGTDDNEELLTPKVGANADVNLDGIDHFAYDSRHEWCHHGQKEDWWGPGGYVPDDDDDADGIPDDEEAGIAAGDGGPFDNTDLDTFEGDSPPPNPDLVNDIERNCVFTQHVWDVDSAADEDWAKPGSQW